MRPVNGAGEHGQRRGLQRQILRGSYEELGFLVAAEEMGGAAIAGLDGRLELQRADLIAAGQRNSDAAQGSAIKHMLLLIVCELELLNL